MSRKLEQTILESSYYAKGDTFRVNHIQTLLMGRKQKLAVSTIKKTLSKMAENGLIKVLPKVAENGGNMYIKAQPQTFEDGKPLASRPWRPGRVVEDHSPRWC